MTADYTKIPEETPRLSLSAIIFAAVIVILCLPLLCGCGGDAAEDSDGARKLPSESVSVEQEDTSLSEGSEKALDAVKIQLTFGNKTETIDRGVFSQWTTASEKDGKISLSFDESALKTFVRSVAKKYNTYKDDVSFTDHSGRSRRVKNMSIGWRLNEAYAAEMLKGYIRKGNSVSADLTDGSSDSKKWWTRYAADYDYESKKGDTFAEVSISEQYMWVVRDGEVILESPIVSGTPGTPSATPTGGYYIFEKKSPCTLSGMGWEVQVNYWVAFNFDIGFHDAYWQESFGGETYFENGSHGCINLPDYAAEALYSISYMNMPVYVY